MSQIYKNTSSYTMINYYTGLHWFQGCTGALKTGTAKERKTGQIRECTACEVELIHCKCSNYEQKTESASKRLQREIYWWYKVGVSWDCLRGRAARTRKQYQCLHSKRVGLFARQTNKCNEGNRSKRIYTADATQRGRSATSCRLGHYAERKWKELYSSWIYYKLKNPELILYFEKLKCTTMTKRLKTCRTSQLYIVTGSCALESA